MRTVFLFIIFLPSFVFSQIQGSDLRKYSPGLQQELMLKKTNEISLFVIGVSDKLLFKRTIEKYPGVVTIYEYPSAGVFIIKTYRSVIADLSLRPEVIFIDLHRQPKEEVAVSNFDISTNKVNLLHRQFPQFNGESVVVSIKEQRPDTSDIDLKGRYVHTNLASPVITTHATIMATIIGGAGNTYYEGKGVATGSTITSARFTTLLPEPDASYQQYNISVQNHSYGTGIENYYGGDALAYDASVTTRNHLLHVFSAGNSGTSTSSTAPYSAVSGYANITGSFKMAKNILTVGHTDSIYNPLLLSSKGPAYDGRVKPELVAFGLDGSSGAAAIVSGIALSLQHAYKNQFGSLPPASLIKAILLNSADDVGRPGIDFVTGYGSVNAIKAIQTVTANRFFSGQVTQGVTATHNLTVPPNTRDLKITLAWTDPPATANATIALVNDLDLEIVNASTGESWKPWVLSHYPHLDSLQALPVRKKDALNPVEQVSVNFPSSGNYIIRVTGFNLNAPSPQSYSISWQVDPADNFIWLFPTGIDNLIGGQSNLLRWQENFAASTGQLEYSFDEGNSWQLIDPTVDLNKGYYLWNSPDSFVTARLRLGFSSQQFSSETFTISKRFNVRVGFDCPDSLLFFWNKQKGVSQYKVYRLGEKYMEPFADVSDTVIMLSKQSLQSLHYAVAPVINNKPGLRSFAFNYTSQGVGCYIKTLFAFLLPGRILLDLDLGTIFRIKTITWEKLSNGSFIGLQTLTNISDLNLFYSDSSLVKGLNVYRVRFELTNGSVFYSDQVSVFYFGDQRYVVYPNPASQNQAVIIQDQDPGSTLMQIYNSAGAKIYEKILFESVNPVPAGILSKGFYVIRFLTTDNKIESAKLIIY